MLRFTGVTQKSYTLGKKLGAGGEGSVFSVEEDPGIVAKIYLTSRFETDEDRLKMERKLGTMIRRGVPPSPDGVLRVSWPLDILYDEDHMVGYVMPRVDTSCMIYHLCRDGTKYFPKYNWKNAVQFAYHLAWVVGYLHSYGIIIGDLNQNNIVVDLKNKTMVLIDCDSFDIRDEKSGEHFRCEVGLNEVLAPEIQAAGDYSKANFTRESDYFSLAIYIFRLLMNNYDPFSGKTISFLPVSIAIMNGNCPYVRHIEGMDIPRRAPRPESLPLDILALFSKTFYYTRFNMEERISSRATAEEWKKTLFIYGKRGENPNLKTCEVNPLHVYPAHNRECPWCRIEAIKGPGWSIFRERMPEKRPIPSPRIQVEGKTRKEQTESLRMEEPKMGSNPGEGHRTGCREEGALTGGANPPIGGTHPSHESLRRGGGSYTTYGDGDDHGYGWEDYSNDRQVEDLEDFGHSDREDSYGSYDSYDSHGSYDSYGSHVSYDSYGDEGRGGGVYVPHREDRPGPEKKRGLSYGLIALVSFLTLVMISMGAILLYNQVFRKEEEVEVSSSQSASGDREETQREKEEKPQKGEEEKKEEEGEGAMDAENKKEQAMSQEVDVEQGVEINPSYKAQGSISGLQPGVRQEASGAPAGSTSFGSTSSGSGSSSRAGNAHDLSYYGYRSVRIKDPESCLVFQSAPGGAVIPGHQFWNGDRIYVNLDWREKGYALAYDEGTYGYVDASYIDWEGGGGGAVSDPHDFSHFSYRTVNIPSAEGCLVFQSEPAGPVMEGHQFWLGDTIYVNTLWRERGYAIAYDEGEFGFVDASYIDW